MDDPNLKEHADRAALCKALGFSSNDNDTRLEEWLIKHPIRDRVRIFMADCDLEGEPPLDGAVIHMSVQVLLDDSYEFRDVLTKERKIELNWGKVQHYIWFVTEFVGSQRAPGRIWRNVGNTTKDLELLCGLTLKVLYLIAQRALQQQPRIVQPGSSQLKAGITERATTTLNGKFHKPNQKRKYSVMDQEAQIARIKQTQPFITQRPNIPNNARNEERLKLKMEKDDRMNLAKYSQLLSRTPPAEEQSASDKVTTTSTKVTNYSFPRGNCDTASASSSLKRPQVSSSQSVIDNSTTIVNHTAHRQVLGTRNMDIARPPNPMIRNLHQTQGSDNILKPHVALDASQIKIDILLKPVEQAPRTPALEPIDVEDQRDAALSAPLTAKENFEKDHEGAVIDISQEENFASMDIDNTTRGANGTEGPIVNKATKADTPVNKVATLSSPESICRSGSSSDSINKPSDKKGDKGQVAEKSCGNNKITIISKSTSKIIFPVPKASQIEVSKQKPVLSHAPSSRAATPTSEPPKTIIRPQNTPSGKNKSIPAIESAEYRWRNIDIGQINRVEHANSNIGRKLLHQSGLPQTIKDRIIELDVVSGPSSNVSLKNRNHRMINVYENKPSPTRCWASVNLPGADGSVVHNLDLPSECPFCKERRAQGLPAACFYFTTSRIIKLFKPEEEIVEGGSEDGESGSGVSRNEDSEGEDEKGNGNSGSDSPDSNSSDSDRWESGVETPILGAPLYRPSDDERSISDESNDYDDNRSQNSTVPQVVSSQALSKSTPLISKQNTPLSSHTEEVNGDKEDSWDDESSDGAEDDNNDSDSSSESDSEAQNSENDASAS